MHVLSTSQLCEMLGVSRSWVNEHLRHLAIDPERINKDALDYKNLSTIWYSEEKILNWFNETAEFSAQTKFVDWADYIPKKELKKEIDRLRDLYGEGTDAYSIAVDELRRRTIPKDVYNKLWPYDRYRGAFDWVPISTEIKSFGKMYTIKEVLRRIDKKNTEMAYRHIFQYGYIRVSIAGRVWFIDPDERKDMYWPLHVALADCRQEFDRERAFLLLTIIEKNLVESKNINI